MANTLAYFDTATITAVKSFIVQAPEVSKMQRCKVDQYFKTSVEKTGVKFEILFATVFFNLVLQNSSCSGSPSFKHV